MATKSKRRGSVAVQFQQARRFFEKGLFKQALKGAKVCYRQQPSERHRFFLQQAYLARGRELYRSGLRSEGRAVVQSLLDLGVTDPEVERELPSLQVALGMLDRGSPRRGEQPIQAGSPLLLEVADHAVLRPQETPTSLPEICHGALQIRAALEALENANESRAVEQIRDIARSSPFADWKYFVRGLAAYYRQDAAEMRSNWDRLDPDRLAARIAVPLAALAGPGPARQDDPRLHGAIGLLEKDLLGESVLKRLRELQARIASGQHNEALRGLKRSWGAFGRFDPGLPQRIALAIYPAILHNGKKQPLQELISLAAPPEMDPHWNRARAMSCELRSDASLNDVESHWLSYIDDLAEMPCLTPAERTLGRALVWLRLGRIFAEECRHDPGLFSLGKEYIDRLHDRAVKCFDNSVRLAPKLPAGYEALAAAQLAGNQPQRAAETHRRLLEHFSDHLDSLLWLVQHHLRRDEPLEAREYARRAHHLKPLDKTVKNLVWAAHVGSARRHGLAKEWDKARSEFEAAERLVPQHPDQHALLVHKAVLELKSGDFGSGRRLLDRAKHHFDEPTPALLILAVEATRYALPKQFRADSERRWITALKKRCRSQTAGEMCRTLTAYLGAEVSYPGRPAHVEHLLAYVRRCSRVKWRPGDLRHVCNFLEAIAEHDDSDSRDKFHEAGKLLDKYVRKGRKTFGKSPFFQYMAGKLEIRKGPFDCNRRHAIGCLERAVKLAENSSDPEDAAMVETARRWLTLLGEAEMEAPCKFDLPPPGSFFGGGGDDDDEPFADGLPAGFARALAKMCASEGLDPEDVISKLAKMMPELGRVPGQEKTNRRKKKKNKR